MYLQTINKDDRLSLNFISMAKKLLFIGADSDNASNSTILTSLGYDKEKYSVTSKEDGPSGGGGDDCCYVTIERKKDESNQKLNFDEDGWPVDDLEDEEEDTTGWTDVD
jgi:hypothetical protein